MSDNIVENKINPYDIDDIWFDTINKVGAASLAQIRMHNNKVTNDFLDAAYDISKEIFSNDKYWSEPNHAIIKHHMIRRFEVKILDLVGKNDNDIAWFYSLRHPMQKYMMLNFCMFRYDEANQKYDNPAIQNKAHQLAMKLASIDNPVYLLMKTGDQTEFSLDYITMYRERLVWYYQELASIAPTVFVGKVSKDAKHVINYIPAGQLFYQNAWKRFYILDNEGNEFYITTNDYRNLVFHNMIEFSTGMKESIEEILAVYETDNNKYSSNAKMLIADLYKDLPGDKKPDFDSLSSPIENDTFDSDLYEKRHEEIAEFYAKELFDENNGLKDFSTPFSYRYMDTYAILLECLGNENAVLWEVEDLSGYLQEQDYKEHSQFISQQISRSNQDDRGVFQNTGIDYPNMEVMSLFIFKNGQVCSCEPNIIDNFRKLLEKGFSPRDLGKKDPSALKRLPQMYEIYSMISNAVELFVNIDVTLGQGKRYTRGGEMFIFPETILFGDEPNIVFSLTELSNEDKSLVDNAISIFKEVEEKVDFDAPIVALRASSLYIFYETYMKSSAMESNKGLLEECIQFKEKIETIIHKTLPEICIQYQVENFPWIVTLTELAGIEFSLRDMDDMYNALPEETRNIIDTMMDKIESYNNCNIWVYTSFNDLDDMLIIDETAPMTVKFLNFSFSLIPGIYDKDMKENLRAILVRGAAIDGKATLIRFQPPVEGAQAGIYGFAWHNMKPITMPPELSLALNRQLTLNAGLEDVIFPQPFDLLGDNNH